MDRSVNENRVTIIRDEERIPFQHLGSTFSLRRASKPKLRELNRRADDEVRKRIPGYDAQQKAAREAQDWAEVARLNGERNEILAELLAKWCICGWVDVVDADGEQIPFDPEIIPYLPDKTLRAVADFMALETVVSAKARDEVREGKGEP